MTSLYELAGQYRDIYMAAFGEDTDDGVDADCVWVKMLDAIEGDIAEKIEGCVRVLKSIEAQADAMKREAERLQERSRTATVRAATLKDYMRESLDSIDAKRFEAGIYTVTVCLNSTPMVEILDMEVIPACFDKVREREVDKRLIAASVAVGIDVPGTRVTRHTHLRIR